MGSVEEKPHAVCIPYPAQGHVNPMLKLAKVLHHRGFHITFINTEFNHRRLLKARGPDSLDGLPDFCFETIPDGLPPSDADATQDIPSLCDSIAKNFMIPFRNLLAKLNDTVSSNVPPVSCIVSDFSMHFSSNVAEELGIPILLLSTASARAFLGFAHTRRLVESGILTPPKDESHLPNRYMETTIDWIPGMKNIRIKDLPSFLFASDPKGIMRNFILEMVEKASKASAIVVNTFDALEHEGLDALSSLFPPVYSIGPLHLLLSQIPQNNSKLNNIGSNLWKNEADCLEWLNSKEPNSVIYVNFGSITVLTPPQMVEFACGLANSKKAFLWVIRPDMVKGDSVIVPHEFLSETKDRGIVQVSWCPQEDVLSHPSIGGFLTHCGWNSMIESMCAGVPVLCWPFFADQQTNCRLACVEWGIGMEIDCNVKRDEVEKLVRELMEGKKGKEMRKHAMKWKKMAEEAVGTDGSSNLNLDKVVKEVMLQLNP
ncbi:hypothetical protein F2P56_029014 [Juglans regia]|uniref:Glycosyltransferase n=2 Tax=Juglans regia TaxID=51240 RepID=A0A2I4EMB7_JUGRE|nr:7-deoxyloganetin glucosyltransferase-like [Juglans regia]KAF5448480.1 hypothetical protein F2P56_029014 [Juglans regia]